MGRRAEYDPEGYRPTDFPGALRDVLVSEFSERFVDGMRNRMIVSFYKYGHVKDAAPERVDVLKSLETRLQRYRDTGNTEWLMDAANFAMIEFMHPGRKDAHFRSTDSDESPGRTRTDGGDPGGKNIPTDPVAEQFLERQRRHDGD